MPLSWLVGGNDDSESDEETVGNTENDTMSKAFDAAAKIGDMEAKFQQLTKDAKETEDTNAKFRQDTSKALTDIAQQLAKLANPTGTKPKTGTLGAASLAAIDAGTATAQPVPGPKARTHSFKSSNLPELTVASSAKDFARWQNAFWTEMDRCGLEEEPVRAQVATLTSAMDHDLREQVSDHAGVDLDDRTTVAGLPVQGILDMVAAFFNASTDHNTAMLQLLRCRQTAAESGGHFLARVKRQARYTAFGSAPAQWRDHLVLGVLLNGLADDDIRDKIGRKRDGVTPDLKRAVDRMRELEITSKRRADASRITPVAASADAKETDNEVTASKMSAYMSEKKKPKPKQEKNVKDKFCTYCKKAGHEEHYCFKKKKDARPKVDNETKSETAGSVFIVNSASPIHSKAGTGVAKLLRKDVEVEADLGGATVAGTLPMALADTGSAVNLMPAKTLRQLKRSSGTPGAYRLEPVGFQVKAANGSPIKVHGAVNCSLQLGNRTCEARFLVADVHEPILNLDTCVQLQIFTKTTNANAADVARTPSREAGRQYNLETLARKTLEEAGVAPETVDDETLLAIYSDVFDDGEGELGKMDVAPMTIELKDGAVPFAINNPRPIPLAVVDKVKAAVFKLLERGVIRRLEVDEPTEWCAALHYVLKKDGDVRIVNDNRHLNMYTKRPVYPMTTARDAVIGIADGAAVFSTLDAKAGYHQVPLDEESQKLTTFLTPWGRFCYTRGTMGLVSAGDAYNEKTDMALEGCQNMEKIVDDLLVYGRTRAECMLKTAAVLEACRQAKIKLGRKKARIAQDRVLFAGYVVDKDGLRPDPARLDAIRNFPRPRNKTDLRSFFGLAEQLAAFSMSKAMHLAPLRHLLTRGQSWIWSPECEAAFLATRREMAQDQRLARYNMQRELVLHTDASKLNGMGFALMQRDERGRLQLLEAGSRALSAAETRYAVIELELAAIAFAVRKTHVYVYARDFKVVTDHRPLLGVFDKSLANVDNARLANLRAKLSAYSFQVEWQKGAMHQLADALSRRPVDGPSDEDTAGGNEVELVASIAATSASTMSANNGQLDESSVAMAIRAASENDKLCKMLRECVRHDRWITDCVLWARRDQVAIADDDVSILVNGKLLVPEAARAAVLAALHRGHIGRQAMLRLARSVCWWPGLTLDVDRAVDGCVACSETAASKQLPPWPRDVAVPTRPFQHASSDYFFMDGHLYVLYIDRLSNFIDFKRVSSTSADAAVPIFMTWFALFGAPERLRTDGGAPYGSARFAAMCKDFHVVHEMSSPHHPCSNGHAEAGVREAKRVLGPHLSDTVGMYKALLAKRNAPLSSRDGASASEIVYGRTLRTGELPWAPAPTELQARVAKKIELDRGVAITKQEDSRPTAVMFAAGERVRVQNPQTKRWDKTGVVDCATPGGRSFIIHLDGGGVWHRNGRFLKRWRGEAKEDARPVTDDGPARRTRARTTGGHPDNGSPDLDNGSRDPDC